ncbi:hypothetical protein H6G00_27225 [Leptolyngbya sp. FACHB-541]|uniref:hypothetical protein n=1 Tax=Leptolyngbya sp. FACHB-541 TaxID=2692810 RepID=UPI0016854490|nr:hypothetical protein [Leptolyngbya sp. FACHB-541]MBD2000253.1 hypothetical protein [Leptolyngbya sp. FACHB-541]
MPKRAQPDASQSAGKTRSLSEKCRKCGMLSAQQAQALHGTEGDGLCRKNGSMVR